MKIRKVLQCVCILLLLGLLGCEVGNVNKLTDQAPNVNNESQTNLNEAERGEVLTRSMPDWVKNAVIYEVNVRQYTKEGTFNAFKEHLPRLKDLGVDVLWFMPIHPISEEKRLGSLGSYYAIKDFYEVNPEFGTLDDFKSLVESAQHMGFKIMLDIVANHTGWDHAWLSQHPEWYTQDEAGHIVHPPGTDWHDIADLNFDNDALRSEMIKMMTFWVKEIGIDSIRADYAGGLPVAYWEQVRDELESIKPLFMLAEDDRFPALLRKAFDANWSWELHHLMNDIAQGKRDKYALNIYFNKLKMLPKGTFPMHFITSHDENSWNGTEFERMGDAVETMAALIFTAPGIPLIYSGQEAKLSKRLAFFDKDEISWDDLSMQDFYKRLVQLKKDNPALWNGTAGGELVTLDSTDDRIYSFKREKDNNTVIVIMNLSQENVTGKIALGSSTGSFDSFITNRNVELKKELDVSLAPWEFHIYSKF